MTFGVGISAAILEAFTLKNHVAVSVGQLDGRILNKKNRINK